MPLFDTPRMGASGASVYTIDQSIRFDSVRDSDLTRTLSGDGDLKTGTLSFWMKRSGLGTLQEIFTTYSIRSTFFFNANDTLSMQLYNGATYTTLTTTAVFRDPSAFAHYLFRWDTTQATDTDRLQFYYNGVLQPVTGTYPAQNSTTTFSDATYTHVISGDGSANTLYEIDGYLAEIHYIDATAKAASDFAETNNDGVWIPKAYSGAYGTNGFKITGADSANLGADESGNSNDFTSSGLATTDQMLDTPTNNFCTLNPVEPAWGAAPTLSDGNLALTGASATVWNNAIATFKTLPSTGKWIWACEPSTSGGGQADPWIVNETGLASRNNYVYIDANGWETTFDSASVKASLNNGATISASYTYGAGDFHVVCFDADTKKVWFGLFDVSASELKFQDSSGGLTGDPAAGTNQTYTLTGNEFSIGFATYPGRSGVVDFGQSNLLSQFTAPTDFKTLCTANLPTPSITDGSAHFQPVLYTGTTSAQDITFSGNSDLAPDWLWFKRRDAASDHFVFDKVRGATEVLKINSSAQEATLSDNMTAFGTDGFSLGDGGVGNDINGISGSTYVAWGWSAGNSSGSTNSDGSLTSTVSVNPTAGFSIAKYVGNATFGATVGHGLGAVPKVVICKPMDATENFVMQHASLGPTKGIYLNGTATPYTGTYQWNDTAPTSSVFSLGNHSLNNGSGNNIISYCFAEIPGYSSFGSYEGNSNADGTFVYTGFKPAFILIKNTNTADQWGIRDAARNPFNVTDNLLNPNASTAETSAATGYIDILSNGFKARSSDSGVNTQTIIYMAFAEHPFGGADIAPATAR